MLEKRYIFREPFRGAIVFVALSVSWSAFLDLGSRDIVQGAETATRIELKNVSTTPPSSAVLFQNVSAFVLLHPVQTDIQRGIVFTIEILNNGRESVEVLDPYDFVRVHLVQKDGYTCSLPPVPMVSRINTGDPEGTRKALDERRSYVTERPREVVVRPGVKTLDNIAGRAVVLREGEKFFVDVRIHRVVADPRGYAAQVVKASKHPGAEPPDPRPDVVPIKAGAYRLQISLFLASGDAEHPGGVVKGSEELAVQLGEEKETPDP